MAEQLTAAAFLGSNEVEEEKKLGSNWVKSYAGHRRFLISNQMK